MLIDASKLIIDDRRFKSVLSSFHTEEKITHSKQPKSKTVLLKHTQKSIEIDCNKTKHVQRKFNSQQNNSGKILKKEGACVGLWEGEKNYTNTFQRFSISTRAWSYRVMHTWGYPFFYTPATDSLAIDGQKILKHTYVAPFFFFGFPIFAPAFYYHINRSQTTQNLVRHSATQQWIYVSFFFWIPRRHGWCSMHLTCKKCGLRPTGEEGEIADWIKNILAKIELI